MLKRKLILLSLLCSSNVFALATTKTFLNDQYMTKEQSWVAYCQNQVRIVNQTDQKRQYTVSHKLCADNHDCVSNHWYVTLDPTQGWSKDFEQGINLLYHREGTKGIWSTLTVEGESHDDSTKYATVFVRA